MFGRTINFGNYGPDHGLVVVDMQTRFLDGSPRSIQKSVQKLIRKIGKHVEKCISAGGEVIFIEYENYGETIAHIRNSANRGAQKSQISQPGNLYRLMKNDNGLLSEHPANLKYMTTNRDFFLKRKGKSFTVCGISAYYCPPACSINLDRIGCRVRLDAGLILNVRSEKNEQQIRKIPRRIIHAPGIKPKSFPIFRGSSFLDYL